MPTDPAESTAIPPPRRRSCGPAHPGPDRVPAGRVIRAVGLVPAGPPAVFSFLSDLENHRLLSSRTVDLVGLEGPPGARTGGRVRLEGPLRLRRTAETSIVTVHEPKLVVGCARLAGGTRVVVRWEIAAAAQGSRVSLAVMIRSLGWLDRALLTLGGRRWLRGQFDAVLVALAAEMTPRRGARPIPQPALELG